MFRSLLARMPINIGERIPSCKTLRVMKDGEGVVPISVDELFKGKKVVMFGVPGAFTPGCSKTHCPSFVAGADQLRAKGVDSVVCMAVNDAYVMHAWGESQKVGDKILMVGDGSAELTKSLDVVKDLTDAGLGVRCERFAAIVDDGVVKHFVVEPPNAGITKTTAEAMLSLL